METNNFRKIGREEMQASKETGEQRNGCGSESQRKGNVGQTGQER